MMTTDEIIEMAKEAGCMFPMETEFMCSDFDKDCNDVVNKTNCWLYQPECGLCPFLKGAKYDPQ